MRGNDITTLSLSNVPAVIQRIVQSVIMEAVDQSVRRLRI